MTDTNGYMGVICINKHSGVTSHSIVNTVRRLFSTKQVGHTGTLDPLANGVLPVMVGRAVKASEYLCSDSKAYIAELVLGKTSDTGDITGKVTDTGKAVPTEEKVHMAVKAFIGKTEQIPPMYSALKVNGRKLVDLARKGIEVERQSRIIHIESINVTTLNEAKGEYRLEVSCSKGTYIRTLCTDIGEKLGCGAVMTSLTRTRSGTFTIDNSITTEELEMLSYEERVKLLCPVDTLFSDCPEVILPAFFEKLAKDGAEIYLDKIKKNMPVGTRVRLSGNTGFFALGEVREYQNGNAIKPIKQFVL